ncbi:MAG: alpha/beta hydrolase [Alphaproteobacteria bacterium]|nr:alpha/beta hydrolase [Alphaproteobacteria bacterium]MBU1513061.1 alpha/beta hydrolase [Alphaproteobacteria bacterium]MBU2095169.1 alpha/beta hydrolase [Alphaproteobacteria bacterium]MBU2152090.1 alpha/beta hydrolase [Alphaproteobacteria bacterium]MBU2306420.1 alpha/beta hydrolase [Alphaproteobacteria bacterium]
MNRRDILTSGLAAGSVAAIAATRPAAAQGHKRVCISAADGVRLFHRDWGEGQPVVFASSWALSSEMWAYQVAHLSERGYRCIAFDRRGHGRSDVPSRGYDMDTLADDLAAVIDALGLKDVILVGHSMGGAEVVHYLARHGAAKVKKVVLVAAVGPYMVQTSDNPYGAPMAYHQATMAEWAADFPKWASDNQAPFFTPETSPAMKTWLTDQLLATPVPVAVATFKALIGKDLRPDLPKIDRPTLVIHGDKDASAPLAITGRRLAAGIRGAVLNIYPGAPHGLFVTHMARLNADLETFFKA